MITPTTEWQVMKTPLSKDEFQVATDLYYVNGQQAVGLGSLFVDLQICITNLFCHEKTPEAWSVSAAVLLSGARSMRPAGATAARRGAGWRPTADGLAKRRHGLVETSQFRVAAAIAASEAGSRREVSVTARSASDSAAAPSLTAGSGVTARSSARSFRTIG